MLADIAFTGLLAIWLSGLYFRGGTAGFWSEQLPSPIFGLVMYVSTSVMILWLHGAYRLRIRWSIWSDVRLILRAVLWQALVTFAFLYLAKLPDVSRGYLLLLLTAQFAGLVGIRAGIRWIFGQARRTGRNLHHVLVLGTGSPGRAFAQKMEDHPELGLRVMGFLGDPADDLPEHWNYLGSPDRLADVVHEQVVDEVAVCLTSYDLATVESIAALCELEGKIVRLPVPMPRTSIAIGQVEDLEGTPVLSLLVQPKSELALVFKRVVDVAGATVAMVVLTPLLAMLSMAILLTDGRPVLFRQDRVGLHGRRFQVVKFRSMVANAQDMADDLREMNEISGHAFKITADPRVTRLGRFLRRSSLDELPQLLNVVRGEMSLVGPRPPLPSEVAAYDIWHRRRLSMKPGITGLWQVEGRRDPEFDRWVEKDLEYIDRWSPWLDFQIMLRTIPAILRAEGR
jgi:exopolysaccharide biosynthesis polyprenyl glycosylphosphotransferase